LPSYDKGKESTHPRAEGVTQPSADATTSPRCDMPKISIYPNNNNTDEKGRQIGTGRAKIAPKKTSRARGGGRRLVEGRPCPGCPRTVRRPDETSHVPGSSLSLPSWISAAISNTVLSRTHSSARNAQRLSAKQLVRRRRRLFIAWLGSVPRTCDRTARIR
jgi:hypothetical protein